MHECAGLFGRIFGHRFTPAYDTQPPGKFTCERGDAGVVSEVITAMSERTFAGAVCVRCGAITKRGQDDRT